MTEEQAKEIIVSMVSTLQGCKATALIAEVASQSPGQDWVSLITECITEGRIKEVEYILPSMNYRIKSFLLPQGTEVTVR